MLIIIPIIAISLYIFFSGKGEKVINDIKVNNSLKTCPKDLVGIITYPIMDKGAIKGLVPLGNSNPPGHTFPVDHIYFAGDKGTKYNVYAAGDGIITNLTKVTDYGMDGEVVNEGITVTIKYCDTISLVNAIPGTESKLISDVTEKMSSKDCKTVPGKHEGQSKNEFCGYSLNIPVKASDIIATTDGKEFPEIWALDYNRVLEPNVDWERYNSPYYQYAFCFFDMYPKDLKDYYYNLFGNYQGLESKDKLEKDGKKLEFIPFIPRTIEPRCGKVMQNINGTAKGDWFGVGRDDKSETTVNTYDLALIEDNQDPIYERIVIGGNITEPSVLSFIPKHTGNINRAFEEVKADGKTYCYNEELNNLRGGWWSGGKIVLKLVDDHHLNIEKQSGTCTGNEVLMDYKQYDR